MAKVDKYHVNPETGVPGPCEAVAGNCRYGGELEHYASPSDAMKAFEETMKGSTIPPTVSHPRFKDVTVKLTGEDGNAFAIMGAVQKALRRAGATERELEAYRTESTAGDYNHLLQTAMRWVNVK